MNKKINKNNQNFRELKAHCLIHSFEEYKNNYCEEIYLDGQHWQLVMIAEDGFTIRIDLNKER